MKKQTSKQITGNKANVSFVKMSKLTKAELEKVNVDELWVIRRTDKLPVTKARLCGCRSVCLA